MRSAHPLVPRLPRLFPLPRLPRRGALFAAVTTVLGALAGLGVSGCDEMPPRAPVDVREAHIVGVELATVSGAARICPGTDVPLELDVDALLPGDDTVHRLRAKRRRFDDWLFDPRDLHLSSPDGVIDGDLVLHTSANPLDTATHGFLVNVSAPGGPSFGLRYTPSYDCVRSFGKEGPRGLVGREGEAGEAAFSSKGGNEGETGTAGGSGGSGPKLTMFATYVRTPYYPKLLAVFADDGHQELALVNPGASLLVDARGGVGGAGGRGGPGGRGGGTCLAHGRRQGCTQWQAWLAGRGGTGGDGGAGGGGGDVVLHVDARYPDIAHALVLDVHGGDGGPGGVGGEGGEPNQAFEYTPPNADRATTRGAPGGYGQPGPAGATGKATVLYDDVAPRFDGRPGITVLGPEAATTSAAVTSS